MDTEFNRAQPLHLLLLALLLPAYILSAINPLDRLAWLGQMMPAVLAVVLLVVTYRQFRFSTFVYLLVFLHLLLLLYGAHYTYSQNPLFNLFKEQFDWQRNYFDRVGHFVQGLTPALLAKEFLLRGGHVKRGKILILIVILSTLGFSAFYELSEFASAKIFAVPPETVMGLQGNAFDSIWDMTMALMGAVTAVFLLGPYHDRQLARLAADDRNVA